MGFISKVLLQGHIEFKCLATTRAQWPPFTLMDICTLYYCFLSSVSSTRDYVMFCTVSFQSQQVALPQAHGPGAVPDRPLMTGQHQLFDLQLPILEE